MAKLCDSGTRREFESGAVRDIAEGKGRCDLLPLEEIAQFFGNESFYCVKEPFLSAAEEYLKTGNLLALYRAIRVIIEDRFGGNTFTAMLELAKHYEDGAKKYDERNWEKGIPCHCFADSAIRHYLKMRRGDTDEPHDRAVLWNLFGLLWTVDHHPELNDLPWAEANHE